MQTALSAATFFKLRKRRANDRPIASIVNSGFAEKSRLNTAKQRQAAVVSPCWPLTPERLTMLAFPNSPFVSSLFDQFNFQRNRRDAMRCDGFICTQHDPGAVPQIALHHSIQSAISSLPIGICHRRVSETQITRGFTAPSERFPQ